MRKFQEFLCLSALLIGVCIFCACSGSDSDDENSKRGVEDISAEIKLCPNDKHPHIIDLGLPSGLKWACCNLGSYKPEEYGGYYAWGETRPKTVFTYGNYQYGSSSIASDNDFIGYDISETKYDAATVNWGKEWHMPTKEQFEELFDNTTIKSTSVNNVQGWIFSSSNGSTIFLPGAGFYDKEQGLDGHCCYWTSSLYKDLLYDNSKAFEFFYPNVDVFVRSSRESGHSIRPVTLSSPSNNGGSNGGNSSGNSGGGNGGSSDSGTSKEAPSFYDFSYSYTETTISVIFATDPMATKATIYYGKSSPSQSVSTTITGRMINATIRGLTKGTKYYVKCVASNSYGSTTSETFPVMTDYY